MFCRTGCSPLGCRSYVRAVARAIRVEPEAAWCEVAESSTAYVAVRERARDYPDRDVMLLWDERTGWQVALEPGPEERLVVLSHVPGDVVPEPVDVARAVAVALQDCSAPGDVQASSGAEPGHVRAQILAYALPVHDSLQPDRLGAVGRFAAGDSEGGQRPHQPTA